MIRFRTWDSLFVGSMLVSRRVQKEVFLFVFRPAMLQRGGFNLRSVTVIQPLSSGLNHWCFNLHQTVSNLPRVPLHMSYTEPINCTRPVNNDHGRPQACFSQISPERVKLENGPGLNWRNSAVAQIWGLSCCKDWEIWSNSHFVNSINVKQ